MRSRFTSIVVYTTLLIFANRTFASTAFDPMIGIHIGQLVANNILASPPMPTIAEQNKSANLHISPVVSYLKVNAGKSDDDYSGTLSGYSAGVGFTLDSKTKLSYYGFATYSQTKGGIDQNGLSSTYGTSLKDMQNIALNLSMGASLRLWSAKDFPLVIGILAGPFVSSFTSKLVANTTDPNSSGTRFDSNYSSDSLVYGPMAGVQGYFQIGGLAVNPYFLYYKDLSGKCQPYKTDSPIADQQSWPDSTKSCDATNKEIYIDGTFSAYGLILGWHGIALNVLSHPSDDSDLSSITVQSYTLSYTLDF